MNKTLLILLFAFIPSQAKTWDSFSALEQGKVYLFEEDSLKEIVSADGDISHWLYEKNVIVPYCDSICSYSEVIDDYDCERGCGIRWNGNDSSSNEDIIWIMAYSLNCQSESMQKFEPMQKLIQNGDATQLSLFKRNNERNLANEYAVCATEYINNEIFHSAIAHAFIYQKKGYYNALCYLYETSRAKYDEILFMNPIYDISFFEDGERFTNTLFSVACVYQDDGTLDFGSPPQMKGVEWVRKYSEISSSVSNKFFNPKSHLNKCPSSKHLFYRINGTSAIPSSSNVIIINNQPKLQLKND